MALLRKQVRPKGLTRKPIYWDPVKEEREEREKRVRTELGLDKDDNPSQYAYRENIRGKFQSASGSNRETLQKHRQKSIQKMLIFIIVLVTLLYLITAALPFLEQFLEIYLK